MEDRLSGLRGQRSEWRPLAVLVWWYIFCLKVTLCLPWPCISEGLSQTKPMMIWLAAVDLSRL